MEIDDEKVVKSYFTDGKGVAGGHPYVQAVAHYFEGDMKALDAIKYSRHATDFYQDVYRVMSAIPAGSVMSYQDIAKRIGRPRAVRAVGTACGRNTLPLIVPCHRVVKSDGTMGNYAFGTDVKQYLLEHEAKYTGKK